MSYRFKHATSTCERPDVVGTPCPCWREASHSSLLTRLERGSSAKADTSALLFQALLEQLDPEALETHRLAFEARTAPPGPPTGGPRHPWGSLLAFLGSIRQRPGRVPVE